MSAAEAEGPSQHATQGADRTSPTRHVPHIDGLRAIAVLAVIAYHFNEAWLPGGFGGVDIFFAISGFVVSASVAQWNKGGFGAFLGYFYARRIQRIAPALLVCLLATSLASALFIPPAWLSDANEQTGSYAFFGLSNWFLANHHENYFSPTIDFNPYTHTWSLGVEEQFYLLFPLLFFAWTRARRGRPLSMVLFAIAIVASAAWAWRMGRSDPASAFYLITTRLWELGAGVLLYQWLASRERASEGVSAPSRWSSAAAWASFALLAYGLVISLPRTFPWPGAVLPVLGTLGLLGFLHGRDRSLLQRVLGSAPMAAVGRLSYSLYLWHWPVLVLLRWTCGVDTFTKQLAGVVLTFALAALSLRFVERPLRYSPMLRRWPRIAVVAAGLAAIVACWWLSAQITAARVPLSLSAVTRHGEAWYPHPVDAIAESPGCRLGLKIESTSAGALSVYSRTGCAEPAARQPTVFLLGDSHATAYLTLLTTHVLRTGAALVLYHNPGCTFVSLQPEREGAPCPAQNAAAVADMLARAKPGDIALLAALRLPRFSNQFAGVDVARARDAIAGSAAMARRKSAELDAIKVLTPLAQHGMHIVFAAPPPLFRAPPFRCADWFNAANPICAPGLTMPRDELTRYRQPVLDSFAHIAAAVPSTHVWDPFPLLCPGTTCDAQRDGRPLFFDGDHLSGDANLLLLPDFERFLAALAPAPP
jgi:peptidoglycan/LPS O-acetylase OafA/YrhL